MREQARSYTVLVRILPLHSHRLEPLELRRPRETGAEVVDALEVLVELRVTADVVELPCADDRVPRRSRRPEALLDRCADPVLAEQIDGRFGVRFVGVRLHHDVLHSDDPLAIRKRRRWIRTAYLSVRAGA